MLVGLTLVTLGGVVLYQLGRYRSDYRYTGRISLVVGALRRGWARARRREVPGDVLDVDRRGAFLVGLLHGTGAETPTQIALFAAAGASGSAPTAAVVLGAFVAGLVVADLGVAGGLAVGRARQPPGAPRADRARRGHRHRLADARRAHPHRPQRRRPAADGLSGPGLRPRQSCVSSVARRWVRGVTGHRTGVRSGGP